MATAYKTVHLAEVASTQDEARRAVAAGDGPVLVVAGRQVAGRGRSGASWWEAPRASYASLALRPVWPRELWGPLPLAAGLAVRDALAAEGVAVGLKWPNDLVTAAGKLGGILVEAAGDVAVVGCGLNLWWPDPPDAVAAAFDADPGADAAERIAASWADALMGILDSGPEAWGRDRYREACVTLGGEVSWEPDGSGRAVDVDGDGALVVETPGGVRRLRSGRVHTVRAATIRPDSPDEGEVER